MAKKLDRSIPNEFYILINELKDIDMRIGQFFDNLRTYIKRKKEEEHDVDIGDFDLFYIENKELIKYMEEYLDQLRTSHEQRQE